MSPFKRDVGSAQIKFLWIYSIEYAPLSKVFAKCHLVVCQLEVQCRMWLIGKELATVSEN